MEAAVRPLDVIVDERRQREAIGSEQIVGPVPLAAIVVEDDVEVAAHRLPVAWGRHVQGRPRQEHLGDPAAIAVGRVVHRAVGRRGPADTRRFEEVPWTIACHEVSREERAIALDVLAPAHAPRAVDRVSGVTKVHSECTVTRLEELVTALVGIDVERQRVVVLDAPPRAAAATDAVCPEIAIGDLCRDVQPGVRVHDADRDQAVVPPRLAAHDRHRSGPAGFIEHAVDDSLAFHRDPQRMIGRDRVLRCL